MRQRRNWIQAHGEAYSGLSTRFCRASFLPSEVERWRNTPHLTAAAKTDFQRKTFACISSEKENVLLNIEKEKSIKLADTAKDFTESVINMPIIK